MMNAIARSIRRAGEVGALAAVLMAGALTAGAQTAGTTATEAPATPATVVTQTSWSPEALEELLAPIALYPDQLLGQVLAASVNPQEVLDAGQWLVDNQDLKDKALDDAASQAGFGPAMLALVKFPTVVDMMCQQIDWTKQLGSAFTTDQKAVLDAVQRLRAQAAEVGNLKTTPQQTVTTTTEGSTTVIEVKPSDPTVVYVPQYDPAAVYTTPAPAPADNTVSTGGAVAGALLAFGVGVMIGSAMNDDYYCYPHWGYGVYMGPRPFYPPAYVYRPVYGPAFHPAYRYAPPPGYRYGYNNRTNIVINNNNYYNRFNGNANLRAGGTRSPLDSRTNRDAKRPTAGTSDRRAPARDAQVRDTRGRDTQARDTKARDTKAGNTQARGTQANRAAKGDRGYGGSTRDAASAAKPAKRDNALSGSTQKGSGSFDRAASARGHASTASHSGGSSSHAKSGGGGRRR